jgi:hypothetical protein
VGHVVIAPVSKGENGISVYLKLSKMRSMRSKRECVRIKPAAKFFIGAGSDREDI